MGGGHAEAQVANSTPAAIRWNREFREPLENKRLRWSAYSVCRRTLGCALLISAMSWGLAPQLPDRKTEPSMVPKACAPGSQSRELIQEIEANLPADVNERSEILARVAKLLWPCDRSGARQRWEGAFELSSTGTSPEFPKSPESLTQVEYSAYHVFTTSSPGKTQARIIKDLVNFGQFGLAISLMRSLPKQQSQPASSAVAEGIPFLARTDQDLPNALVLIPMHFARQSPGKSVRLWNEILTKFDRFPYAAASDYIRALPKGEFQTELALDATLQHFSRQNMAVDDVAASGYQIEQFMTFLSTLDREAMKKGALLVERKLDRLRDQSAGWREFSQRYAKRLCDMGVDDPDCEATASPAATKPRSASTAAIPEKVRKILEVGRTRNAALVAAKTDLAKAENLVLSLDDVTDRADLYASLGESLMKDDRKNARRFIEKAVALLTENTDDKAKMLITTIRVAKAARLVDDKTLADALRTGLHMLSDDTFVPSESVEHASCEASAIQLLGMWARIDPENALDRIHAIADRNIRARALTEMAEQVQSKGL